MDLLKNPKLPNILRRLNTKDFKKFDTFMWNGSHITAVIRYLHKSGSIDLLEQLEASRNTSRYPRMVLSFKEKLREFFRVPKMEFSTDYKINELLASFLDFLLDIVEESVKCHANLISPVEEKFETLQIQLKLLITILGDSPFSCTEIDETNIFLQEMEAMAKELAKFLYLFFFTDEGKITRMDLPLTKLLKQLDLFEPKIKKHCVLVSKLPSYVVPNTTVDSLFIVDSLLNDLENLLNRDHDLIVSVCDQIRVLQNELIVSRTFLEGSKVQYHSEIAARIKNVAYEAEYVINSFVVRDIPTWYLNLRLPDIIQTIKLIWIGFKEFKNCDAKYCISTLMVGDIPVWYLTPRFSDVFGNSMVNNGVDPENMKNDIVPSGDDIIVGFKNESEKITGQLLGEKKFQIILISGMAGLGKTTLAKKLYNNPAILHRFDRRAWCVASQTYRKKNLLINILSSVSDLEHQIMLSMNSEDLGLKLHKTLLGRRYLIVVDNVWDINVWEEINIYLPDDGNGSRILLTSRNKHVTPDGSLVHSLPFLSHEECWDLLQQKVFPKGNCPEELIDIAKKIAALCHRLPLAVVVIASVLVKMDDKKRLWNEVLGSLNSEISKDPNKCMNILELSYKHLPSHLKPCFLYFGAFPEDRDISVKKLISLWIAEGFVLKEGNKSLEDIAEEYLIELINRNLVLVYKRRADGGIKTCISHDLLRYFCLKTAKDENFLNLIEDQFSPYEGHHRLRIPFESINVESRPFGLYIRTLLGRWSDFSFSYSRLKRLRILDFSTEERSVDSSLNEDLDIIGIEKMVYLKYLEVRLTAKTIPISLCNLQNLEFLHFDGSGSVEIPASLTHLLKLRHLYVKTYATFNESCHKEGFEMNFLETISYLWIVHENDEKILKCFPRLHRLKCATKPLWDPAEKSYRYLTLDYLNKIESLNISYLCRELKFSATICFPKSVKKLSLNYFKLSWKEMSMIGRLPKLEILKLSYPIFEGKEWRTNDDEFEELLFLKLDTLQMHRWTTSSCHFPKLQRLVMQKCWKLKKFPCDLGECLTLQTVDIHSCRKSMVNSALKIQKEQQENGNEFKVIVYGTCW